MELWHSSEMISMLDAAAWGRPVHIAAILNRVFFQSVWL
jgi:hypothetical protein